MGDRQCEGTRVSGSVRCARAVQPLALCGALLRKSGPASRRPPVGEQPWGRAGYVSAQSDGLLEGNPASGPGRPGERALELAKGHAPRGRLSSPHPFTRPRSQLGRPTRERPGYAERSRARVADWPAERATERATEARSAGRPKAHRPTLRRTAWPGEPRPIARGLLAEA